MYLESLLRLAEIVDHYNNSGETLIDREFHDKTSDLIETQSKFLIAELEFRQDNPGPYNFGFGDLVITLYSPEETGIQEWAAIARKGKWQKNYRFNSVMSLVKTIANCIEDSSETPKEDDKEKE